MRQIFRTSLLLTLLLPSLLAAQEQRVGMVLMVDGDAELERAGETVEVRMAQMLLAGDRVRVQSGQMTFLFCPSVELVQLAQGAQIQLDSSSFNTEAGPQPLTRTGRACTLPKVALGGESLERVGGLRARGFPPIVVFVGGQLSSARPSFDWEPVEGVVRYELNINDARGRSVLKAEPSAPGWQPEEALEAGTYQWELLAYDDEEAIGRQLARFTVKPAEISEFSDDTQGLLLKAMALEDQGFYSEAAGCYRQLREMFPEDERLTRRLAWLYWNSGLIAAANKENEKLK